MKRIKVKKVKFKKIYLVIVGFLLGILLIPNTLAASKETIVPSGIDSLELQTYIDAAEEGEVLVLQRGNYGKYLGAGTTVEDREKNKIKINKSLTIRGQGDGTTFDSEVVITGTTKDTKVNLENYKTTNVQKEVDQNAINVTSPVTLTLKKLNLWEILRGTKDIEVGTIDITSGASGSLINVVDSTINGSYDGVFFDNVSNVTMNVANSTMSGTLSFAFDSGSNNALNVSDGSVIGGRSSYHTVDEAISIANQENLTINIEDSTIDANNASDSVYKTPEFIFSFDGDKPSSNVKINITGDSVIIDKTRDEGSAVFNFGKKNASIDTNVIKIGSKVKMQYAKWDSSLAGYAYSPLEFHYKYNENADYAVVGIQNKDGDYIVKAYDKNKVIPSADLPVENYQKDDRNYKLKKLTYLKKGEVVGDFEKTTPINENMDITPLYVKELNVKIGSNSEVFHVYEEDSYNELLKISNAKTLLDDLKDNQKLNKVFKDFYDSEGNKVDENYVFTKDTTIVPKYNVEVTVKVRDKEEKFLLEEGKSLSDIEGADLEKLNNLKKADDKTFSRFVDSKGETFEETKALTENITLTIKQKVKVTINQSVYEIEEDKMVKDLEQNAQDELNQMKSLTNKKFIKFVDADGVEVDDDYKFTKDTTIIPKYNVEVTIKVRDKEEKFLLEEGKSLSDIEGADLEKLNNLKKADNKTFSRFVDSNGETFEETKALNENTTLTIKQKVKVTINKTVYEIEEDKTLNDLEQNAKSELDQMKSLTNKKFIKFVDLEGAEVDDDYKFTKDTTIIPQYNVIITIEDKEYELLEDQKLNSNEDIIKALTNLKKKANKTFKEFYNLDKPGEVISEDKVINENLKIGAHYTIVVTINEKDFTLDEGLSLNDLKSDGKNSLEELKNVNKILVSYLNKETKTEVKLTDALHENITIIGKYNVKVTIDNLDFIIEEGKTLEDIKDDRLTTLKNKDGKTFSRFLHNNETFAETTKINENITLTIKQKVKVTIENKDYFLEEGQKLNSSHEILEALNSLRNLKTKNFKEFYNADTNVVLEEEMVLNSNLEIKARYTITITIDGEEYELAENKTLNDLETEVLEKLKEMMQKEHFDRFASSKGETIELTTKLTENTEIIAKFDILVTIGEETFVLEEGKTLNDLNEADSKRLEEITKPVEGETFVGYKVKDSDEIITNETPITKDITLEVVFEKVPEEVPKTLDNIVNYIVIFIVSLVTVIIGLVFLKRHQTSK